MRVFLGTVSSWVGQWGSCPESGTASQVTAASAWTQSLGVGPAPALALRAGLCWVFRAWAHLFAPQVV